MTIVYGVAYTLYIIKHEVAGLVAANAIIFSKTHIRQGLQNSVYHLKAFSFLRIWWSTI